MAKKKEDPDRELWNGYRPCIIQPRKGNKKKDRVQNKQICRDAKKGENE